MGATKQSRVAANGRNTGSPCCAARNGIGLGSSWKWVVLTAVFCAMVLASCDKEKPTPGPPTKFEVDKKYERGPVRFELKVDRKEITIADRINLLLEVTSDENYEVELPKFGEKLEQFGIVDYDNPPLALVGGGHVLYRRSYELEPFLSGEYKIPALKIVFWKKDESKPQKHELESEAVVVKVKSLLPEKTGKLTINGPIGPMDLPGPDRLKIYLAAGTALLACVLGGGWAIRRRRKQSPSAEVVRITAHVLAISELEQLLAEQLLERREYKHFYFRLSNILRHYIENRFALRAPERTTEEFLAEIRDGEVLNDGHKRLLTEFLTHCDLVKFAELLPTNDEIQTTFDLGKQFIVETAARDKQEGEGL